MNAATIASHRFGFTETSLGALQSDPRGWVLTQFKQPTPLDTQGLLDTEGALALTREVLRAVRQASSARADPKISADEQATGNLRQDTRRDLRQANMAALQRRWQHVVSTNTPVAERWVHFWANHFCVAATKATTLALVWPFEQEAIRPHAFGNFKHLLRAAVLHPAMLLYLDNAQSIGPDSPAGQRREKGLNENLARELLELHTLGAQGGYSQQDVTQTARLLTGWTVTPQTQGQGQFVARLHQPGSKNILGKIYPEGPEALDSLLLDLSQSQACARHVASKLARHFVADDPPTALVNALSRRFLDTNGDLLALADSLFSHDLAWRGEHPGKFKRPEELWLSAHRLLKLPVGAVGGPVQALAMMGQAVGRAPSPQGWPDRTEDWLSPDALLKRVQWADQFAQAHPDAADARALARLAWGDQLSASTVRQIERAESGAQALALMLASPEFQRR